MNKKAIYLLVGIILVLIAAVVTQNIIKNKRKIKDEPLEHIITIQSDDKKIKAETGSFCYRNGACIDKVDFQDFNYDSLSTYYDNKLYIENLDGNLKSITESSMIEAGRKIRCTPLSGADEFLVAKKALVSMNMLIFDPSLFEYLEEKMDIFR